MKGKLCHLATWPLVDDAWWWVEIWWWEDHGDGVLVGWDGQKSNCQLLITNYNCNTVLITFEKEIEKNIFKCLFCE